MLRFHGNGACVQDRCLQNVRCASLFMFVYFLLYKSCHVAFLSKQIKGEMVANAVCIGFHVIDSNGW